MFYHHAGSLAKVCPERSRILGTTLFYQEPPSATPISLIPQLLPHIRSRNYKGYLHSFLRIFLGSDGGWPLRFQTITSCLPLPVLLFLPAFPLLSVELFATKFTFEKPLSRVKPRRYVLYVTGIRQISPLSFSRGFTPYFIVLTFFHTNP